MKRWVLVGAISATLAHAEPVDVFGVPLGGKLGYPIKSCKNNFPPTPVVCWVDKPYVGKSGARSGSAMLPDHKLPEWAVHRSASIGIAADGTVERVDLRSLALADEALIRSSIERRFGSPQELSRPPNGSITGWKKENISISMLCSNTGSYCATNFVSAAEAVRNDLASQEAQRARLARPQSP